MKKLGIAAAICASLSVAGVQAKEVNCDVTINYALKMDRNDIRLFDDNREVVKIDGGEQLYIGDRRQTLDDDQQALVSEYAARIRKLAPIAARTAREATTLGLEAAEETLVALLGPDNRVNEETMSKLRQISQEIRQHLREDDLDWPRLERELEDGQMGHELESLVARVIASATASITGEMVSAAIRGDKGRLSELEARLESLDESLGDAFESRAEQLGEQAEYLCDEAKSLDALEARLVTGVKAMAPYELLTLKTED